MLGLNRWDQFIVLSRTISNEMKRIVGALVLKFQSHGTRCKRS